MKQTNLTAAVVSLNIEDDYREALEVAFSQLPPRWASLVVLPFGFQAGGNPEQVLAQYARELGCYLIGGFPRNGTNVAVVFSPEGQPVGEYAQTHCLPGESIRQGNTLAPIATPMGRIGLSIGSDIYFPEIHWSLAQQGADQYY